MVATTINGLRLVYVLSKGTFLQLGSISMSTGIRTRIIQVPHFVLNFNLCINYIGNTNMYTIHLYVIVKAPMCWFMENTT